MKVFAAPGIDSTPFEQGVFNSGAAFDPNAETAKVAPYDWGAFNPVWGLQTAQLIAGYDQTTAPDVRTARARKRGQAVFGGPMPGREGVALQNPGGSVDTNAGARMGISGGKGQASSMVRTHGRRPDAGMRLPVIPKAVDRGGKMPIPAGGGFDFGPSVPIAPKMPGFPSVIRVAGISVPSGAPQGPTSTSGSNSQAYGPSGGRK